MHIQHTENIVQLFLDQADRHPDHTALISKQASISYGELAQAVRQTAAHFHHKGIRAGDRVLVFVPMGLDLYRSVLALFYMGATAVFLDEWVSKSRMELCCRLADCKAMIGIPKARVYAWFSKELRRIPIRLGTSYPKGNKPVQLYPAHADETALITFTTGSTGIPKAANRTHGFLAQQFWALTTEIQPQPTDVAMPVLPIVLLMNLGAGACSVIADFKASKPEKMKPEKLVQQIQTHQVSRITASPYVVKRISQYIIDQQLQLPSVRQIFTGGAPVFPEEAQLYLQAFPTAEIRIEYGSTEAEPISSIDARELVYRQEEDKGMGLRVGNIFEEAEVRIIEIIDEAISLKQTEELDRLSQPPGNIGEIIVKGPHVLKAYYNNPEAFSRNKIVQGDHIWHRTGDAGFLGEDGSLYLTGRCKTMIRKDNRYLAPFLYEHYFQQMEGVGTGTLLALENQLMAVAETRDPARKHQIISQLQQLKLPFDELRLLDKIPRDPRHNSKIDYGALLVLLQA